jgi:hypothetical protein
MATVYTLAHHLVNERDPLRAGVISALLERVSIMELLPFSSTGKLNIKVNRWKTLPAPAFRNLNESFTSSIGTNEQLEETVYVAGGNIDIERIYTEDQGQIVDPRQDQIDKFMAATGYMINDYFINGDQATDPKGFTGVRVRVGNLAARQTVSAAVAADGLDVRASEANEHIFLDKVNESIHKVEDGKADAALMNTNSFLGFTSVMRRLKLLDTTKDMFDREVLSYKGVRLIDMGPTLAGALDDSVQIITQTEAYTGGGTADGTSIFFVRFGRDAGEHLHGIEMHPLRVTDIGLLESGASKRTNIEWPLGLAMFNPRSIVRLRDISWQT